MIDGVVVGRVAAVLRYPVKSMAAEPVEQVDVSWHGLSGDRRWAFVRPDVHSNGFPWLTLRHRNDLNDYHPCWVEPESPDRSSLVVHTPTGDQFDVTAPALAAELGAGVRVMKLDRGAFDTLPLSLITTRTVKSLETLLGTELNVRRFRPNLVIEAFSTAPFPEDEWVGRALTVGTAGMRIDGRDKRCVVVNIDPVTGRRSPAVLRTIAAHRDTRLGVYASTTRPGHVAVGDPVVLHPGPPAKSLGDVGGPVAPRQAW
ncbi:MOSC domain-containing protein [Phytohabitans flavus]|uniref:MOSC domain-containing protein n=3 Tax=Phytohabitans flavus TaxID=1076124 RepID=A0A6F8XR51_9ACTN|nr:MOSC N-terminal beta barrel domain-containing protein [Phytohabitans flavus]BCB76221.1 MOSC domain-containing protein [Phytohabitans flavus]